jgi:ATP-dependent Lon protease
MPRRYNLRKRPETVKWVEDDTLLDKEDTDAEDSDYEPPLEEEESEDEMSVDDEEDDEDIEDDNEDDNTTLVTKDTGGIRIPMPRDGVSINISIKAPTKPSPHMVFELDDEEDESEKEEESEEEDDFLQYLANKYVPPSRVKSKRSKKSKKEDDSPAMALNDEEQEFYEGMTKAKRRKLNEQMQEVAFLMTEGDVPHKFRVLEAPVSLSTKAMVLKKLDTLEDMDNDTNEAHKLRSWVDGFLRIPFASRVPLPVKMDDGPKPCAEFLSDTRKTLDKAVYGMNSAKTQIMQILAQWISNPASVGNVIALKGPMGVGKTSFAKNGVAAVLKRPFEFFSLGGASDAANFVGHAYTYEGSTWGRVVDSLITARCMNPVMYFDELDKVSTTPHGEEIVSMLIHMTDRSQNTQFHDRYFAGVDFDLSQCLFVFSFNDESKVHPILKDRMQVIHCAGYTADEKKIILTQYVWPQVMERIKMDGLTLTEEAVKYLINDHSREEEGVRTLIRTVETLVTRINLLRIADEETAQSYKFYKKLTFPCSVDVELARHILQDLAEPVNESWRRMYM